MSSTSLSNLDLARRDDHHEAAARDLARGRAELNSVAASEPTQFVRVTNFRPHQSAVDIAHVRRPQSKAAHTHPLGGTPKRLVDIVTATTALVLLGPLMLVVMLLIYVRMGRPIFFRQKRIGFDGTTFQCLKFRTMVNNSEMVLRQYLDDHPEAASEWRERQKLQRDPRVTALGRLLRRSSIDELPQLINVLQGQMSCVGPRPVVEVEIARYGDYWNEYVKARPGLSGAWQVSGRNRLSYQKRVALDRWYTRRWSFWLDLWLLAKTIPAVLKFDDTT